MPGGAQLSQPPSPGRGSASSVLGQDETHLESVAAQRQAEWERQILSIDMKEKEVHQTQLRLIREQTAAFIRDLKALRQEVTALRNSHPTHQDVVARIEAASREQAQRLEAHKAAVDQRHGERGASQEGLEEKVRREQAALSESHGSLAVRVSQVEERLMREVHELKQALSGERALRASIEQATQALCNSSQQTCLAQHSTLVARLDYLEQAMGQAADRHSEELQAQRSLCENLSARLAEHDRAHATVGQQVDQLHRAHGEVSQEHRAAFEELAEHLVQHRTAIAEREAHHTAMATRVEYLEKVHGDTASKHSRELERTRTDVAELHSRLVEAERTSAASDHARRLDQIERAVNEAADKHKGGLQVAHGRVEDLHNRMLQHQSSLLDQQTQLQEREADHAAVVARVAALETRLDREVHSLRLSSRVLGGSASLEPPAPSTAAIEKRLDFLERSMGQATHSRLEELHGRVLEQQTSLVQQQAALQDREVAHGSAARRLEVLEKALHESSVKQTQELERARNDMKELRAKVDEAGQRESFAPALLDRIEELERAIRGAPSPQGSEHALLLPGGLIQPPRHRPGSVESLRARLRGSDSAGESEAMALRSPLSLGERVAQLEQAHAEQLDRLSREVSATSGRLQDVQRGLQDGEAHRSSANARLDGLERAFREVAAKYNSLLELPQAQHRLAAARDALDARHCSLAERVDRLEASLGEITAAAARANATVSFSSPTAGTRGTLPASPLRDPGATAPSAIPSAGSPGSGAVANGELPAAAAARGGRAAEEAHRPSTPPAQPPTPPSAGPPTPQHEPVTAQKIPGAPPGAGKDPRPPVVWTFSAPSGSPPPAGVRPPPTGTPASVTALAGARPMTPPAMRPVPPSQTQPPSFLLMGPPGGSSTTAAPSRPRTPPPGIHREHSAPVLESFAAPAGAAPPGGGTLHVWRDSVSSAMERREVLFNALDLNQDGVVTRAEFNQAFSSGPLAVWPSGLPPTPPGTVSGGSRPLTPVRTGMVGGSFVAGAQGPGQSRSGPALSQSQPLLHLPQQPALHLQMQPQAWTLTQSPPATQPQPQTRSPQRNPQQQQPQPHQQEHRPEAGATAPEPLAAVENARVRRFSGDRGSRAPGSSTATTPPAGRGALSAPPGAAGDRSFVASTL